MSNTPLKIDNFTIKKAFYVKFMLPKGLYRHSQICNNFNFLNNVKRTSILVQAGFPNQLNSLCKL